MKSHFIYILFVLCSIPLLSQNGTVTGSVSDSETNEPLPGVNVVVKNTTKGTNTDFDGNFSIEGVSSGDVLSSNRSIINNQTSINGKFF